MGGHGSLLEGLGESGVSVRGSGNILRRSTVLECQNTLGDHLSGVGADNVDTENTVGLGVSEELDHTVRVGVGLCSRVGREGEGTDLVLDTGLLELGLVLADPGNLGVCVHDGRNGAVVDVAVVLCDEFDGGDGLLLGLVGKHGTECDVSDDTNVGDLGAVLLVDDNAAAVVGLETDVLQTKTGGVGTATDGDEDDVCLELCTVSVCVRAGIRRMGTHSLLLAALGSLDLDLDVGSAVVTLNDLCVELELDALLAKSLLDVL